jgi:hypothetical protein
VSERSRPLTPKQIRYLAEEARKTVIHLERPGMPADALCSHFGIMCGKSGLHVTIDENHHGRLLLRFEIGHPVPDLSWLKVQVALVQAFECQVWDTDKLEHGHSSSNVHVTLCRLTPPSLRRALHNYRELEDVFADKELAPRYEAFRRWFDGE